MTARSRGGGFNVFLDMHEAPNLQLTELAFRDRIVAVLDAPSRRRFCIAPR
ncbi:MAG TPA: hypothetical protein VHJ00_15165 [Bradyrhizobium sp.]|nr:hypothetical protein [Bradyrhizobium sp.]